jgi:peptidyl-prolyl cis-trans isomerase B (cyclophilin B)
VPTNEQRRATAKRKLERQLERRAKQAKRRRQLVIGGGAVVLVAVIAAIVAIIVTSKDDKKSNNATTQPSTSATTSAVDPANPQAGPLPAFKAPANLGANCQYPQSQEPAAKPVKPPHSGKIPTDPATVSISMTTNQGHIGLLLNNAQAPCTVNNFVSLATQGFFNDTKCHRLTTSEGLAVLQCGDPNGDGKGGPGYQFANEYPTDQYPPNDPKLRMPVIYPRGTIAMAHSRVPNSNGSQFFLVYKDSQLPPDYTAFGKIQDDGLATLDKIAKGGVVPGGPGGPEDGTPVTEVVIKSVLPD